jgi:hypothetical protein
VGTLLKMPGEGCPDVLKVLGEGGVIDTLQREMKFSDRLAEVVEGFPEILTIAKFTETIHTRHDAIMVALD